MSKTPQNLICRHYLVSGRVQGVGFRRFTEREANAQALTGRARNLRDGRVEVVASGSEESLEIFEGAISRGPLGASVSQIEKHDVTDESLNRFTRTFADGFSDRFIVHKDGEKPWL